MRMRFSFVASFVMCCIVAEDASAQQYFYFVRDLGNPNQLQTKTGTSYLKPPASVSNSSTSAVMTDAAAAAAAINDANVVASNIANTSIGPYDQPRMSLAAYSDISLLTNSFMSVSAAGSFGVIPPMGAATPCVYNGITASDIYPNGTACTVSGQIDASWSHTGPAPVTAAGRNLTIKVLVGGVEQAYLNVAPSGGSAAVTKRINGVPVTGQTLNLNSDAITSLNFSVSSTVGTQVRVEFQSTNAIAGMVMGASQNHDNLQYTVNVDVGP